MIDLNHIPERHDTIHARLEEWSRWVRVKPQAWAMQPMFRLYKAPKQWEHDAYIPLTIDTLAAHEIEQVLRALPDKHRDALRWAYVFAYIPINKVRRSLGVTLEDLHHLLDSGRDMLNNRLKEVKL